MKNVILKIVIITALIGMLKTASAVSLECMEFETFLPNVGHPVGTTHTQNNLLTELVGFEGRNGVMFFAGTATAVNSNHANGSGQELNLTNINLRYTFDFDQPYIVILRYKDTRGDINLGINGILTNTDDLSDLNGMNIGGVEIIVTRYDDPIVGHHGTVTLVGPIEKFGIGGQVFWVDDICALFG
jgi:hypothetical protein